MHAAVLWPGTSDALSCTCVCVCVLCYTRTFCAALLSGALNAKLPMCVCVRVCQQAGTGRRALQQTTLTVNDPLLLNRTQWHHNRINSQAAWGAASSAGTHTHTYTHTHAHARRGVVCRQMPHRHTHTNTNKHTHAGLMTACARVCVCVCVCVTGALTTPVIVAVIDTAFDLQHPDIASRLWVNTGEIPNNGIDDDGNGQ